MPVYAHMHPDDADNKEEAGSIGVWYTDISIAAELLAHVGARVTSEYLRNPQMLTLSPGAAVNVARDMYIRNKQQLTLNGAGRTLILGTRNILATPGSVLTITNTTITAVANVAGTTPGATREKPAIQVGGYNFDTKEYKQIQIQNCMCGPSTAVTCGGILETE